MILFRQTSLLHPRPADSPAGSPRRPSALARAALPFVLALLAAVLGAAEPAPFLPPDGRRWLIIGQDLGAVGGTGRWTDGYVDHVGWPAGVTAYTSTNWLTGLDLFDNWGAGDVCARIYLEDPRFDRVFLVLGVSMVNDLDKVAAGRRDANLEKLAAFIGRAGRPVFLRLGYEFDGGWNNYDPEKYRAAWRHAVDFLRARQPGRFATVWQSTGLGSLAGHLAWYPGDDYVDWLGYSYFDGPSATMGQSILELARQRRKPVMIAEATPRRDLSEGDADAHWRAWFEPFFRHIEGNADVIRAVAYINARWMDQRMWRGQGWGDSRVQANPRIRELWLAEIGRPAWLGSAPASGASPAPGTPP